jgi:hypothetical protein
MHRCSVALVLHELTDLPDDAAQIAESAAANDRIRTEGTANLLAAARAAGCDRFIAQSIAWRPPGRGARIDAFEQSVLDAGGVILRYGQFYGPGTYYEDRLPAPPRIQIGAAAEETVRSLHAPSGIVVIAETV